MIYLQSHLQPLSGNKHSENKGLTVKFISESNMFCGE